MPKKVNLLDPWEREKECTNHVFMYRGKVPLTGRCLCYMCNTEKRGYIVKMLYYTDGVGGPIVGGVKDRCNTCGLLKAEPEPGIQGPVTEPFPDWACLEIWCAMPLGGQ